VKVEMIKIDLRTVIMQNTEIDASDLNGDKVMMNLNKGKYYALNGVGSVIWDKIESPISVDSLVNNLLEEYDIDKSKCEGQVIEYLEKLENEKLICIC
jgi:myo-inositol-1-phosphate synthase